MQSLSQSGSQHVSEKKVDAQPNNPLHGITLAVVLERLVDHYGWEGLSSRIDINCFHNEPSVKSSLKFLRKQQWARDKVEALYIATFS